MALYKLVSIIIYVYQVNLLNSGEITCSNQYCANQTVTCSPGTDCVVNCIDNASCAFTEIHGPINNILTINCRGNSSCFAISIYCPVSTNSEKNCFIKGNDNLSGKIQIYSINGWQNIDIQYEGTFTQSPGAMHCGSNYTSQCIIQNDWSCSDNQCSSSQLSQPRDNKVRFSQLFVIVCGAAGILITACCVCGVFSVYNMLVNVTKNTKNKYKCNSIINASVAPESQIADSGKLPVSMSPQVDMTITIATTYNCKNITDPSDPKKQHSRYATAIYSGSPLNNVLAPKSATEIEIDTDWYMQQISEVAEQIKSKSQKQIQQSKSLKKIRFKTKRPSSDPLEQPLTPKTPIEQNIVHENENETDLLPLSYVQAAKNTSLVFKRTSSLREMDTKEVEQFRRLSVYHESLVEDVVMSQDIMTPNSPL